VPFKQQNQKSRRGFKPQTEAYQGWKRAWARSLPVEPYAQGLDVTPTLRTIRENYPLVLIRYDPMYRKVVVWRKVESFASGGLDTALQFWSPFDLVVDRRLFLMIRDSNQQNGEIQERDSHIDEENERRKDQKIQDIVGKVDGDRLEFANRKAKQEMFGKPFGLRSFVPADLVRN
jgi:hypothetical protein